MHADFCPYWQRQRAERLQKGIQLCMYNHPERQRPCNNKAVTGSQFCHCHANSKASHSSCGADGVRREQTHLMHIFFLYAYRDELEMPEAVGQELRRDKWKYISEHWFDGVLTNVQLQSHANRYKQWTRDNHHLMDFKNTDTAWHLKRKRLYLRFNLYTLRLYIQEYEKRAATEDPVLRERLLSQGQCIINNVAYNFTPECLCRADGLFQNFSGGERFRVLQAYDGYQEGVEHTSDGNVLPRLVRSPDLGKLLALQQQCIAELITGEGVQAALSRKVEEPKLNDDLTKESARRRRRHKAALLDKELTNTTTTTRESRKRSLPSSQLTELLHLFVLYGMRHHAATLTARKKARGKAHIKHEEAPQKIKLESNELGSNKLDCAPDCAPNDTAMTVKIRASTKLRAIRSIAADFLEGVLPVCQVKTLVKRMQQHKTPLQVDGMSLNVHMLDRIIDARGQLTIEGVPYQLTVDGPRRLDDNFYQWTTFTVLQALDGYACTHPDNPQSGFKRVGCATLTDLQRRCLQKYDPSITKALVHRQDPSQCLAPSPSTPEKDAPSANVPSGD